MLLLEVCWKCRWQTDAGTKRFRDLGDSWPDDIGKVLSSSSTVQEEREAKLDGEGELRGKVLLLRMRGSEMKTVVVEPAFSNGDCSPFPFGNVCPSIRLKQFRQIRKVACWALWMLFEFGSPGGVTPNGAD